MSLVVRVIAPTGRDAELICSLLAANGISAAVHGSEPFRNEKGNPWPIGPLLIAEEALTPAFIQELAEMVRNQPSWSDLPILVLTASGRETRPSRNLGNEWRPLGFPVLLERPIRTGTLISSVRAALRARSRQYQIRDVIAELKQERETLQAILDNLPVGVILARSSGEVVLGNRRVESILRHPLIPTSDLNGHGNWTAFHPDGRRVLAEEFPLPRAMKAGRALPPEEYLYQRGDGIKVWITLSAAPIFDEAGKVTGGVVAIADIDQQKKAEAALIQNEKLAAVGRLATSISHEINNPLESVINLVYLARQGQLLPREAKEYLDSADHELARVAQIVSHTLRFYRQATKPRSLFAEELIQPTLGLYAGRLLNSGIHVQVQHRDADPVTCYEGEIRQVLNNLVGNAIEAMRAGGRLLIRSVKAHCWNTGTLGLWITVADSGHGMTKEVQARLFEAFHTTKGENGTGLGLWISRGIIDKHRGVLQVRSTNLPGRSGTVFRLFLPYNSFR